MSSSAHGGTPHYFVPQPSRHPMMAAVGLLAIIFGAAMWINGGDAFKWLMFAGFLWLFVILFQWFRDAIETPSMVIMYEEYLKFRDLSQIQQLNIVKILLHEIAHMWFGTRG